MQNTKAFSFVDRFWRGLWHSLQNYNTQLLNRLDFWYFALELRYLRNKKKALKTAIKNRAKNKNANISTLRPNIKNPHCQKVAYYNSEENATDCVKIGPQTKMKIDFPFSRKTALENQVLLNIRRIFLTSDFFFFYQKFW